MSGRAGVAIVTGASRGIGRAIARAVAEAGYDVAVNYRDREKDARAVVEEIARAGGRARAFQGTSGRRIPARRWSGRPSRRSDRWTCS